MGCDDFLEYLFKGIQIWLVCIFSCTGELSLFKVDLLLHQMHSYKCLISLAAIMLSFTDPGMYFDMFGVRLCVFVN